MRYYKIIRAFDWRGYLEAHHKYKPTQGARGEEYRVCCPFCHENDFKCYVNIDRKIYCCFKCGVTNKKADVYEFVAATEGISKEAAITRLFHEYKDVTPDEIEIESKVIEAPAPSLKTIVFPSYAHPVLPATQESQMYYDYLKQVRKFTDKEIQDTQTHYCSQTPLGEENISQRVLWPVYGGDGQLVSWVARDVTGNSHLKYKNAKHSDLNKVLWPNVKMKTDTAIIVEGIIDAVAVRRLYPDVYCSFGKHLSQEQVQILKAYNPQRVILFWDKKDAKPQMISMAKKLSTRFKQVLLANFAEWPDGNDSGDFMRKPELENAIRFAVDKAVDVNTEEFIGWQL